MKRSFFLPTTDGLYAWASRRRPLAVGVAMAVTREMLPKLYTALEVFDGEPLDMRKHKVHVLYFSLPFISTQTNAAVLQIRAALGSLELRGDELNEIMARLRDQMTSPESDDDSAGESESTQDDNERKQRRAREA